MNIKNQISKIKYQIKRKLKIVNCKSSAGFTLIELLIVIAIIAILTSFVMANYINVHERSRDTQRKSDLRQIQAAFEMYRADQSTYPPPGAIDTCDGSIDVGGVIYLQRIPCDPREDTAYNYSPIGPSGNCSGTSDDPCTSYTLSTNVFENTSDQDSNISGGQYELNSP